MKIIIIIVLITLTLSGFNVFSEESQSILLISVDTLRHDKIGAYGYMGVYTPWIDKLVKSGTQFETSLTTVPRTNPSFGSLFTSKKPEVNGVRSLKNTFEPFNKSMAEILEENGYYTAAITSNPLLGEKSGFAQGFQYYYNNPSDFDIMNVSSDITNKTIEIINQLQDRKFFLWVHYSDPHYPYKPPYPYDILYIEDQKKLDNPLNIYEELKNSGQIKDQLYFFNKLTDNQKNQIARFYLGTITYTDKEIGKIIKKIKELKKDKRLVTIFLSDHGESLGEHEYYYEHGDFTYEPELRIPLVFKTNAKPSIEITQTNILDILPTLQHICNLKIDNSLVFDGISLVNNKGNSKLTEREFITGESGLSFYPKNTRRFIGGIETKWRFLRTNRWKLILKPQKDGENKIYFEYELYDLLNDPCETMNLYPKQKAEIENYGKFLIKAYNSDSQSKKEKVPDELKEKLKSLGYMN